MISEIMDESFCRINVTVKDWEDCVRQSGKILLENGCVEQSYIDDMVNVVNEYGPYIVIMPGVCLAHARPEAGAKKIGVSVMTLAEPVYFGNPDNDPVTLVLGLAAIDNNSHLDVIKDAVKFLSDESIEKIHQCKTAKELSDHLKSFD